MKNVKSYTGTLRIVERMKNSVNGNPRFRCYIENEAGAAEVLFVTKPDSAYAYDIGNLTDKQVTANIGIHYGIDQLDSIEKA